MGVPNLLARKCMSQPRHHDLRGTTYIEESMPHELTMKVHRELQERFQTLSERLGSDNHQLSLAGEEEARLKPLLNLFTLSSQSCTVAFISNHLVTTHIRDPDQSRLVMRVVILVGYVGELRFFVNPIAPKIRSTDRTTRSAETKQHDGVQGQEVVKSDALLLYASCGLDSGTDILYRALHLGILGTKPCTQMPLPQE